MNYEALKNVENEALILASKIDVPHDLLPAFGEQEFDAQPNVYALGDGPIFYHYIQSERGIEHERKITRDINELLYCIFSPITTIMAQRLWMEEKPSMSFRRYLFQKQEELMGRLRADWLERAKEDNRLILIDHPFRANE
jgi:hypothetical protein